MTLLQVNKVTKKFGSKTAIDNLSFSVKSGEIVGLLGRNGAGKTTIMKGICGCLSIDSGSIEMNGKAVADFHPFNSIGVLIEASFFDHLNTYENLKSLMILSGEIDKSVIDHRIEEVLKVVGLQQHKKSYVGSFSFGMKQRLGLAQTLLGKHDLLMLDEPFVGLDPPGRKLVKELITRKAKDDGVGILFSSHNIKDVLEISDRIVVIDHGKKMYDGAYYNNRHYRFQVSNMSDEIAKLVEETCQISTSGNTISISESSDKLNELLGLMIGHDLKVESIENVEESLDRYFEEEVEHVD
ncbi:MULTISPECIES: ABC transporter ATP-binding protein [unclassified Fusibacter]|uniref:ABC transporter ATP-binding protein n=1 Tax=unclassified Fusibacter TaxID=2624464 RepID=UPI0013E97B32|nr:MULTISPECIES: ABC transporter ATP-binding protein [unclassified Fusibacter]MCK8061464.1 ABC transporter ATP-binding protein [Fusibacter sp. A2]NPE23649.1 ABC transporter ATP-binding protein [Fusibacter sp. A1]